MGQTKLCFHNILPDRTYAARGRIHHGRRVHVAGTLQAPKGRTRDNRRHYDTTRDKAQEVPMIHSVLQGKGAEVKRVQNTTMKYNTSGTKKK